MAVRNKKRGTTKRNTGSKNSTPDWIEVEDGVSFKGTAERFSISWFGAVIHGCRIIEGNDEYDSFIAWPSFKSRDGSWIKTSYIYAQEDSDEEKILFKIIDMLSA